MKCSDFYLYFISINFFKHVHKIFYYTKIQTREKSLNTHTQNILKKTHLSHLKLVQYAVQHVNPVRMGLKNEWVPE